MNLDYDKRHITKKKGDYCTGEAIYLADPSLHTRAQDYKRQLSAKMRAVSAQDIARIQAGRGYTATRKYDGERQRAEFRGDQTGRPQRVRSRSQYPPGRRA